MRPAGDQQHAIDELLNKFKAGKRNLILHGVTGTGKTFVVANIISKLQVPSLIICHSKDLCRQTFWAMQRFFKDSTVEMYMSKFENYVPEHIGRDGRIVKAYVKIDETQRHRRIRVTRALENGTRDICVVATCSSFFGVSSNDVDEEKIMVTLRARRPDILKEAKEQADQLSKKDKIQEAQRLIEKTEKDMNSVLEGNTCNMAMLVKKYGYYLEARPTLLDLFQQVYGKEWLLIVDESHKTLHQLSKGNTTMKTKKNNKMVDLGYKLPSAARPLQVTDEIFWKEKLPRYCIFVSATPGEIEKEHCDDVVTMIQRPTHILDPPIEVLSRTDSRPEKDEIRKLVEEAIADGLQVIIFCIKKCEAVVISRYLKQTCGLASDYITCDRSSTERKDIIDKLKRGVIHVLACVKTVGEGMDFPGVGLVLVLNADAGGFLRDARSLEQLVGRAARNPRSKAIMYAKEAEEDRWPEPMRSCIAAFNEHRMQQKKMNDDNNLMPRCVCAGVHADRARVEQQHQVKNNTHKARHEQRRKSEPVTKKQAKKSTPMTKEEALLSKVFTGDGTPELPGVFHISGRMAVTLYGLYGSIKAIKEAAEVSEIRLHGVIGLKRSATLAEAFSQGTIKRGMDILECDQTWT